MSAGPTILHVVGARPNFMKIAPIVRALDADGGVEQILVHTGQHYDENMSEAFFRDLELREPDMNLGVGSGTHAEQTAGVMRGIEPVLDAVRPDLVVVVGDVNSTLAAALTATKKGIAVAHVEAGLRSRDRTMPEEINRELTDRIAELLFTPSPDADRNLRDEGIASERIHRVGNVMIDTLVARLDEARRRDAPAARGLEPGSYDVVTLHRPSNVDDRAQLAEIFAALATIAEERPVVFPMHPRTRERAESFGLLASLGAVRTIEPVGYLEMIGLVDEARLVLTDSGGAQEETTALGVPCLTLRSTTERPITIEEGTNTLVEVRSRTRILEAIAPALEKGGRIPDLWDGRAAERIAAAIRAWWRAAR